MADYNTLEASTQDSRPLEVYEFVLGGSQTFRYSSAEDDIVVGANTFTAERGLSRTRIVQGGDQSTGETSIFVKADNEFASQFADIPPGVKSTVKAFRVQRDQTPAPVTVLIFTGLVQDVRFVESGDVAEIITRSVETVLNQQMPRMTSMRSCNNFLYDRFCGVDPAAHNLIGQVTLVDGANLTVSGVGASSIKFRAGVVKPTAELNFRLVLAESGDVLTLESPFGTDLTGQNVQVFAGCDHIIDGDCALVFDNVINFNGNPWVPTDDINRTGIKV